MKMNYYVLPGLANKNSGILKLRAALIKALAGRLISNF